MFQSVLRTNPLLARKLLHLQLHCNTLAPITKTDSRVVAPPVNMPTPSGFTYQTTSVPAAALPYGYPPGTQFAAPAPAEPPRDTGALELPAGLGEQLQPLLAQLMPQGSTTENPEEQLLRVLLSLTPEHLAQLDLDQTKTQMFLAIQRQLKESMGF
eukprot:c19321_g1_i2.p1 GENE.c19321_g1_i2~~c19321_g1_i2.p1  ORF type:complete len:156 (+),score=23.07 c19321_g1_i2:240-707(+)